jgi:3-methyladenine DNA glycosylase/8-oxoguanine DNA glycosylase
VFGSTAARGQNASVHRRFRLPGALDLGLTLGPVRRGPRDPTLRFETHACRRATRTPQGPAALHLRLDGEHVEAEAWGAGAEWALDAVPDLLGFDDDTSLALDAPDRSVRDLARRAPGLRIGRTAAVFEALVPSILEQKVPSEEAHESWRRLVWQLGEPAPGPTRVRLPPSPETLAATPYSALHGCGIERRRADVIRHVSTRAPQLERLLERSPDELQMALLSLPGIGPWTAAKVAVIAMGDRDAVSVGDYHFPHLVAWTLAGEARADDARMLELLEPYRGQRARVIRLVVASGSAPPRRAPRTRLRSIDAI